MSRSERTGSFVAIPPTTALCTAAPRRASRWLQTGAGCDSANGYGRRRSFQTEDGTCVITGVRLLLPNYEVRKLRNVVPRATVPQSADSDSLTSGGPFEPHPQGACLESGKRAVTPLSGQHRLLQIGRFRSSELDAEVKQSHVNSKNAGRAIRYQVRTPSITR